MAIPQTTSRLLSKCLFYAEPIVWVEGKTDFPIYQDILRGKDYRLEIANGTSECEKLIDTLVKEDLPYIVIQDGDYKILNNVRSRHQRAILLNRYSCENYLAEKNALMNIIKRSALIDLHEKVIEDEFDKFILNLDIALGGLVSLDIANRRSAKMASPLPVNIKAILINSTIPKISKTRVDSIIKEYTKSIDHKEVAAASIEVKSFCSRNSLLNLIPGHLVFSILRNFYEYGIIKVTKKQPRISNNALRCVLSTEVWSTKLPNDHKKLKRKVTKALYDATQLRRTFSVVATVT